MLGNSGWRSGGPWLALLMMIGGWCPPRAYPQTASPPSPAVSGEVVSVSGPRSALEIVERFARVLEFPQGLARVDGFDPTVLSITPMDPAPGETSARRIRVQALSQGVTTIVVTDADGRVYNVEVLVSGDARVVETMLRRLFPNTAVQVSMIRNTILLRGWVAEPHQITEIVDIASRYGADVLNQMKVAGPQDVQLRVKILEAQRSAIRRFGINFSATGRNAVVVSTPGPISPLSTLTLPFGGPPAATFADNQLSNASLALGIATDNFVFEGLIQALKEEGLLKISAEPVLVTRSGEGARLINGGEFPIPVPQSLGTVTIEWREFGVVLESLPIVLGPNTLKQQIRAEVSERDFSTAVTLGGTTVPGLTKRTVETQTVMEFGQTLVIGGLIASRYTAETDKLPFLGELPGVGAAFRRVRYDVAETELIVLITPEYVAPMSAEQVPPGGPGKATAVPTDRELIGSGFIEVPNYGDPCAGPDCPPLTAAPGPAAIMAPPATPAGISPPSTYPGSLPPGPTTEDGLISPPTHLPPLPHPGLPSAANNRRPESRAASPSQGPARTPTPPSMASRPGPRTPGQEISPAGHQFEVPAGELIEPARPRRPSAQRK
jgi:pilus assembly protein CpaC